VTGCETGLRAVARQVVTARLRRSRPKALYPRTVRALRGGRGTSQEIAAFTSSATFFSTMGLHFLSAYDTGHMSPSRSGRGPGDTGAVPYDPTIYLGSAARYRYGRPAYSPELETVLTQETGLDGNGRLLDVGCGPGVLLFAGVASRVEVS
jgi:hypothetical protein